MLVWEVLRVLRRVVVGWELGWFDVDDDAVVCEEGGERIPDGYELGRG